MTRPEMIRADTIDLQDRAAPSAKDHYSAKQSKPGPEGPLGAHQAETLREVAAGTAEDRRVSWNNGDIGDLQQYAEGLAADVAGSLHGHGYDYTGGKDNMDGHQQQDALAIAQNGGQSGTDTSDDGDLDGDEDADLDDDMMDKISSSPSIEDEDIDFEFVYALHTFVATVEGQANATKGDTMVLLDDSNSYWWLVRVVKDSSIGYLPAEHIETPTERLARLNKHRNIDLSATMLGDQAEKTKPTIRSAMRRRRKTVTFAAPTYVDYSDIEYSTDEEGMDGELFSQEQQQQKQINGQQDDGEQEIEDDSAKVEPLKPRAQKEVKVVDPAKNEVIEADGGSTADTRTSEEIFETSKSETPGPTRLKDGTVRDSFFKDDTVETKKITLTPNLLRDDGAPRASTDSTSKDTKPRTSLDKLDKELILGKDDKKKKDKDKKDKNKKSSGIRGFFSRKDKKGSVDEDDEPVSKRSIELGAESQEKHSEEFLGAEDHASADKSGGPQRQHSKLQKQQHRTEPSSNTKPSGAQQRELGSDITTVATEGKVNSLDNVPPASMRIVGPDAREMQNGLDQLSEDVRPAPLKQAKPGNSGVEQAVVDAAQNRPQQVQVVKAKSRVALDESDSPNERGEAIAPEPSRQEPLPEEKLRPQQPRPILPGAFPDSYISLQSQLSGSMGQSGGAAQAFRERHAEPESPVSPEASGNPPALMGDTSSQEGTHSSPSSSPSPDLAGTRAHAAQDSVTTSTTVTNTSTWNDAKLRAFFDSSADIRNLLLVVYDKTDVIPAGSDHPFVGSLFREQNAKLAEITTQLDNMLGDWLARKQRLRGAV